MGEAFRANLAASIQQARSKIVVELLEAHRQQVWNEVPVSCGWVVSKSIDRQYRGKENGLGANCRAAGVGKMKVQGSVPPGWRFTRFRRRREARYWSAWITGRGIPMKKSSWFWTIRRPKA
jgi:hypothetical protein